MTSATKAGHPTSRTPMVDWAELTLTHRCNMKCFFCYEEARGDGAEPPLEQVMEILRQTHARASQVVLCGREVLLRRDVLEVVRYATDLGLRPVVFTNGQALRRDGLVEALAAAGCVGVAVSFHFPDRAVFERCARVKARGFDRVLEGLARLRDFNLANPSAPLAVTIETDLFALNAGRLDEMRRILIGVLHGAPWKMRLASLLPCSTYDVGLANILCSLDERREEIAEFVSSHPDDVPLGFVKVPLCLLPPGKEHLSLDVQYVYEGTTLTFNHLDIDTVTLDAFSISTNRDLERLMRGHPYRWICRSCEFAAFCRFERVSWKEPRFVPDRRQRPLPYLSNPSASPLAALPIESRTATVDALLAPLGGQPGGTEGVDVFARLLGGITFPEERILRQLVAMADGGLRIVDVWSEGAPLFHVRLDSGGEPLTVHVGVPGRLDASPVDGFPVGYLLLQPAPGTAVPGAAWDRCLALFEQLRLPAIEDWHDDEWFDAELASLVELTATACGRSCHPGREIIAGWRVQRLSVVRPQALRLRLAHGGAGVAELSLTRAAAAGSLQAVLEIDAPAACDSDDTAVLEALGHRLSGTAGAATSARGACAPSPDRIYSFDGAGWRPLDAGERFERHGAIDATHRPALDVRITHQASGNTYRFHVARYEPRMPCLRRIEEVALWYSHEAMDDIAREYARALLMVVAPLRNHPPDQRSVGRWRDGIAKALEYRDLSSGCSWSVEWSAGATSGRA